MAFLTWKGFLLTTGRDAGLELFHWWKICSLVIITLESGSLFPGRNPDEGNCFVSWARFFTLVTQVYKSLLATLMSKRGNPVIN